MTKTALDLTPKEWRAYRPIDAIEYRLEKEDENLKMRWLRARQLAHRAAQLLREEFGAGKIILFGSLAHRSWFTHWSDIDLAAWGIPPERFFAAMATDVSKIRPAVISESTCDHLDEYRGFRHVVRNVYTFRLDPAKVEKLVEEAPDLFAQARAELLAFAEFLEKHSASE